MTKYDAAVRENKINKVIWHMESGTLRHNFQLHQRVLKAQLRLEKDKFDSWHTSHKDKAKNLYRIKKQAIDRILETKTPDEK